MSSSTIEKGGDTGNKQESEKRAGVLTTVGAVAMTGTKFAVDVGGRAAKAGAEKSRRGVVYVRDRWGKAWAPVAPLSLAAAEVGASLLTDKAQTVPVVGKVAEMLDKPSDMVVSSGSAWFISGLLTLAAKGVNPNINVDNKLIKRGIEGIATVGGMVIDLATGVHAPGQNFAEVPAIGAGNILVSAASSVLGSIAGHSSARALVQPQPMPVPQA